MDRWKEWLWVFGIRVREYYYPWTLIVQTKMYLRGFTKANRIFSSTPTLFGLFFFCLGLIQFFLDIPLYMLKFVFKRCPESWQEKVALPNSLTSKLKGFYYGIMGPASPLIVYLAIFYLVLGGSPNLENQRHLVELHQKRTAIAIRDSKGNLIGIDDFQSKEREPALYVDTVPTFFWEMLIFREHKELDFNDQMGIGGFLEGVKKGSYKGVDVFAPLGGVFKTLIPGLSGGGGSTPMNFMTKNLYGESYFNSKSNRQKHCPILIDLHPTLCRKWVEYRSAKDLFPLLSQNDGLEFKRWVSMHVPLVKGVGGDLYGIQAASAVLFGKKPENLTMAEQAILAKAYLLGIRFRENDEEPVQAETCLSSDGTVESPVSWSCFREVSLEQWSDICSTTTYKDRNNPERWGCKVQASEKLAVSVVERLYAEQREEELEDCTKLTKEECIEKLDAQFTKLETPNDPKIPLALEKAYGESTDSYARQIANFGNLENRVSKFMSGYKRLVQNDLIRHQQNSTDPVVEVKMTMSLKQDFAFRQEIDTILTNLQNEHHFGGTEHPFNKKLVPPGDKDSPINELPQASIRIAVSTLEGEMLLYYLRRNERLEENLQLTNQSYRYPLRPMGSTVKIASAALLVSKGINALCNKSYAKKGNVSGRLEGGRLGVKDCSPKVYSWEQKGELWPIEQSFRHSFNLTFRWGLDYHSNIEELQQVFTDFGMTVNPKVKDTKAKKESKDTGENNVEKTAPSSIPFADYVDNMSFGDAQSTPAQTHRIINKVGHLLLTPEEEYYGIRSVSSFTTLSEMKGGSVFTVEANTDGVGELEAIEKYFPLEYREKMTKVMSAPITGTLRGVAPKLKGGRLVFGKTGTMDTDTGNTKDKYVVGVLEVNDQYYSFSILIGADDYDEGLIKKIGTSELMRPIVQQIIKSLSTEG